MKDSMPEYLERTDAQIASVRRDRAEPTQERNDPDRVERLETDEHPETAMSLPAVPHTSRFTILGV